MDFTSEQVYGSTLSFSVVCSEFEAIGTDSPAKTIIRTFDKTSTNLSQYGCWHCIFEESKKQRQRVIELYLSLNWVLSSEPPFPVSSSSTKGGSDRDMAYELIGRINSVKIRSDSTLSELLVDRIDGRCLHAGGLLKVRLQPDRVLRNGRYKFMVGFYTQDILRTRRLERQIFTSFVDIDPEFDPTELRQDETADVTFEFPAPKYGQGPITIQAHSSALQKSRYFEQRMTEVVQEKAHSNLPYNGITCVITEFSPNIFRAMLRYLYTGHMRMRNCTGEADVIETLFSIPAEPPKHDGYATGLRGGARSEIRVLEKVCFEDLYRISERYEIPGLRTLSLKAMQYTLDMSIAIAMLIKLPCKPSELRQVPGQYNSSGKEEQRLNKVQLAQVVSTVKEYIQFFGLEVSTWPTENQDCKLELSVEDCLETIRYIGDCVLNSVSQH
ncbi:hypothetical protein EDD21DRAFT_356105 [Dissophora ornata]|nr:hypothetical protein BGZ58_008121 [Dissophora ornata]KAI8598728.1 hypothetical protein EDD21DRAFT_356105 [Dissophora ornata]